MRCVRCPAARHGREWERARLRRARATEGDPRRALVRRGTACRRRTAPRRLRPGERRPGAGGRRAPTARGTRDPWPVLDLVPIVHVHVLIAKFGNLSRGDANRADRRPDPEASDGRRLGCSSAAAPRLEAEGDPSVWVDLDGDLDALNAVGRGVPGRGATGPVRRPAGLPADACSSARSTRRTPRPSWRRCWRSSPPSRAEVVADQLLAAHPGRPRPRRAAVQAPSRRSRWVRTCRTERTSPGSRVRRSGRAAPPVGRRRRLLDRCRRQSLPVGPHDREQLPRAASAGAAGSPARAARAPGSHHVELARSARCPPR